MTELRGFPDTATTALSSSLSSRLPLITEFRGSRELWGGRCARDGGEEHESAIHP
jgi:hypothetical protein